MKLLHDSMLLRALNRLLAGRRQVVRRSYAITVPAPLQRALPQPPVHGNVIELHRRSTLTGSHAPTHALAVALPSSAPRARVATR